MSTDTEQLQAELEKLIQAQPGHLLDNFGIRINMADLDSWLPYEEAGLRLYGSGFWSRLWCRHLRPRLFRARQERAFQGFNEARMQFRMEVLGTLIGEEGH